MKHRRLTFALGLTAAALLAAPAVSALSPRDTSLSGAWLLVAPAPDGAPVKLFLDLRARGERVVGVAAGIGGSSEVHGRLRGDRLWLTTVRPGFAGPYTLKLAGRLRGDAIRGRVVTPHRGPRRDRRYRPFTAVRR